MVKKLQKLNKKRQNKKSQELLFSFDSLQPDWLFESELISQGFNVIAGCDDAGRGPLAGPVFAACVIFHKKILLPELNDSKLLSSNKREELFSLITSSPDISYGIGMSTVREIDEINILKATFLAMKRAFYSLKVKPHGIEPNTPARRNLAEACQLTSFNDNGEIPFPYHPRLYSYGCLRRRVEPDALLVDGNASIPDIDCFQKTIIKGDARSFSIAAASILAKVSRDSLICEYAKKYPQYEFEKHKGYGTRRHMELIKKIGPCPIHRKTFAPIKQMLEKKE